MCLLIPGMTWKKEAEERWKTMQRSRVASREGAHFRKEKRRRWRVEPSGVMEIAVEIGRVQQIGPIQPGAAGRPTEVYPGF